jgi:hypothetical protein
MKIVRVLKVVDTRQREEINDRFVPIPGSGHENECFRCGKFHEIHATVLLEDGKQVILGTGCAAKEGTEFASQIKSLESAAKRLAKLKAQKAAFEKEMQEWEAVRAIVWALPVPALEDGIGTFKVGQEAGQTYATLKCGDVEIRCGFSGRTKEREECAVSAWRNNRMADRGFNWHAPRPDKNFAKEIAKLEKKLA